MDFQQIYETCYPLIYAFLLKQCGDAHLAEEITADTFFKALRSIDKFRGECDIRVWLCQIAKNSYYSHVKRAGRTLPAETALPHTVPDSAPPLDEQLADKDTARQIQALLHTLPDPYKEVFLWRVYAELSFKQIGELFGKTDNWACVTYHRARMMLKSRLEEQHETK
jgi:RNA polymerase sigma-70 factor (ECF subfamily)